jgi:hypothetical protein
LGVGELGMLVSRFDLDHADRYDLFKVVLLVTLMVFKLVRLQTV